MDYWDLLDLKVYDCLEDFLTLHGDKRIFYATTKGHHVYSEAVFQPDDFIMFGKESAGIPEEILKQHPKECIRIPMGEKLRSLNLANSVAIILYEALRQQGFLSLQETGELHRETYIEE